MIFLDLIRGGETKAQVAVLATGKCVVAWPTSTIVYDSFEALVAVHVEHMAGRGEPTVIAPEIAHPRAERGMRDCYQDDCENVPFAGIGGPQQRHAPQLPDYLAEESEASRSGWLLGYQVQAALLWGSDWRNAEFGWAPALVIGAAGVDAATQPAG